MPNANTVTRLGQTFAKRSLLLRTKDDHPIVKDLRKRRLQVQMKRDPEVGERVEAEEDAEVITDRQVMRIGGFLRGDLLDVERPGVWVIRQAVRRASGGRAVVLPGKPEEQSPWVRSSEAWGLDG